MAACRREIGPRLAVITSPAEYTTKVLCVCHPRPVLREFVKQA